MKNPIKDLCKNHSSAAWLLVIGMLISAPLLGKENPSALKIGIVNMQEIILNVEDGKSARSALEKEIKAKEEVFNKDRQEHEKLNDELQKQSALLSEEARAKKQKELQEKVVAQRKAEMEFQQEIKQKEMEATQKIALKAAKICEKLAQDQEIVAVFEANQSGIVFLAHPHELTKEVIAVYNAQVDTKKGEKSKDKPAATDAAKSSKR